MKMPKMLENRIDEFVGPDVCMDKGYRLYEFDIKFISLYVKYCGGDRQEAEKKLWTFGRPFRLIDESFNRRCRKCNGFVNYCLCSVEEI